MLSQIYILFLYLPFSAMQPNNGSRRVVEKIWCIGPVASRKKYISGTSVRMTSPSFTRWRCTDNLFPHCLILDYTTPQQAYTRIYCIVPWYGRRLMIQDATG